MKKGILILTALLFTGTLLSFPAAAQKSRTSDYRKYAKIIREKIYSTYRDYCREPGGICRFHSSYRAAHSTATYYGTGIRG